MIYLLYFLQAWLIFVTPLIFLNYKTTIRQQFLFTIIYGLGIIFSRNIYNFIKVPFGIHTILLLILSIILFKNILKDFGWQKSIYTSLIVFIIILINDALIVLPFMKLLDLNVGLVESDNTLAFILISILSNLLLILACITSIIRNLVYSKKNHRKDYSQTNE